MRRLSVLLGLSLILAAGVAAAGEQTITLAVENMDCAACPLIVKQSLTKVEGVRKAQVSYERKTAVVTFDDAKATVDRLIEATTKAGYPARVVK